MFGTIKKGAQPQTEQGLPQDETVKVRIASPLRVLVCGADKVPQIDKTLELFGKKEVLSRIASGIAMLG